MLLTLKTQIVGNIYKDVMKRFVLNLDQITLKIKKLTVSYNRCIDNGIGVIAVLKNYRMICPTKHTIDPDELLESYLYTYTTVELRDYHLYENPLWFSQKQYTNSL